MKIRRKQNSNDHKSRLDCSQMRSQESVLTRLALCPESKTILLDNSNIGDYILQPGQDLKTDVSAQYSIFAYIGSNIRTFAYGAIPTFRVQRERINTRSAIVCDDALRVNIARLNSLVIASRQQELLLKECRKSWGLDATAPEQTGTLIEMIGEETRGILLSHSNMRDAIRATDAKGGATTSAIADSLNVQEEKKNVAE